MTFMHNPVLIKKIITYTPQNWAIFKLWPQMSLVVVLVVGYRVKNVSGVSASFIISSKAVVSLHSESIEKLSD